MATKIFKRIPQLSYQRYYLWKNKRLYAGDSKYGENLSVVLHGPKDMRIEKRPMPKFKDNQVLLQMETVGICGSDVAYYLHGRIGNWIVKKPMIIGHEASGTVLECGKKVKHLKPGDRVAIEPQMICRHCYYCKSGHYNLCPDLFFCATPPDDGNLSRYYVHDADFCFKLPKNLDFEHGCLMEPLSVAIHSCRRSHITSGDSVLILGAGTIGLVNLLAVKAYGASQATIIDVNDFRLKKAMELGADFALNVKGCSVEDIVKTIHSTLGHKPNKIINCTPNEKAFHMGLKAVENGGCLVVIGHVESELTSFPISEVASREIDILGIFRYVNDYQTGIDQMESGLLNPKPLVTHHFKLEESAEAFKVAGDINNNFIKIVIHVNPNFKSGKSSSDCKSH